MGKILESIDDSLRGWIEKQKVFFVATAPLSAGGHANCSPKGLDTFRVLGPRRVVYQDLTGSGVETISHLRENGRITIMFCAFEGAPQIVRLQGRGTVFEKGTAGFCELASLFDPNVGERSIIEVSVNRISSSCGFAVPLYEFQGNRDTLDKYSEKKGEDGMAEYRRKNNRASIDGLPGLVGIE